jgi:L-seryl-tRNA(Ser) seleniumtransferase
VSPPEDACFDPTALPSVDRVLRIPGIAALIDRHGHAFVAAEVRKLLADWRHAYLEQKPPPASEREDAVIVRRIASSIAKRAAPSLRPVFNLTGTVLHTNLGRALLCGTAADEAAKVGQLPVNLEFDVVSGERGDRDSLVEALICEITGAEAATVVNNNAAAVLLSVAALAARREAVISRGELVEIGGAFRMPDVMRCAGTKMVEVGTTNRTHPRDYRDAITRRTALILKVHTSNYVVHGFTATVGEAELATIAHDAGLPFAIDLGSGSLVDLSRYGLPREPLVQDALANGADVVTFSGDKLLGGPQAGLIVGKREFVARIRKHPLKRALRVSKLTLAALERTLALYRDPERLAQTLPTLRFLTRPLADIRATAERAAEALRDALGDGFDVAVASVASQIGSGALPVESIPSAGIRIRSRKAKATGRHLTALASALRELPIPVIGRIEDGALVLDLRMLDDRAGFVAQLDRLVPPA